MSSISAAETLASADFIEAAHAQRGFSSVEVTYNNLSVTAARTVLCGAAPVTTLLDGVSGALRPGTTTLVLGPPGSGKTVFLKAITGRQPNGGHRDPGGNRSVSIAYNGRCAGDLATAGINVQVLWGGWTRGVGRAKPLPALAQRLAAYEPQADVHDPLLVT